MLDHNSIDLFTVTFFLLRPASVTWQRTYTTLKVLNYFSDHLHWKHVPLTISLYIWQMREINSDVVLHVCSTTEIQMWAKIFKYHLFSSARECQLTVSVTQLLWNLYSESFTFLTLQWFHLSLYPTQLPVVNDKYGPIALLLKICSLCYSRVSHRNHVATECARAVYCFRKKHNTQKAITPKQEMSFLLNQCPTQIQTMTCNCRTARYNTWGERGKGKWRMTISSAGSSQLALLKCSIKTALEVQWKR